MYETPIDLNGGSGDISRVLRSQECHEGSHFFRVTNSSQGDILGQFTQGLFFGQPLRHACLDA